MPVRAVRDGLLPSAAGPRAAAAGPGLVLGEHFYSKHIFSKHFYSKHICSFSPHAREKPQLCLLKKCLLKIFLL